MRGLITGSIARTAHMQLVFTQSSILGFFRHSRQHVSPMDVGEIWRRTVNSNVLNFTLIGTGVGYGTQVVSNRPVLKQGQNCKCYEIWQHKRPALFLRNFQNSGQFNDQVTF